MKRHGTHGCGARWVVSTYNSSTQDAEEGGSQVRGQPGLHRETISPKNNVGGAIRSLRDDVEMQSPTATLECYQQFCKRLTIELPLDPAISPLEINQREM
jgi:hypothetical protein